MKNIKGLLALLISGFGLAASAQQDPNFTLYRYNMNLINPAFAGSTEATELGLLVRSQWASVEGAPETQSLVFGMPLGRNVGLGVSAVNDRTFIESQTFVAFDFSYRVQVGPYADLFFGLKAGVATYKANTDGLLTYGIQQDPSLTNLDGRFNPNVGAGVYLRHERFFLSFSVPKILTPDRLEQRDGMARLGVDRVHAYLSGGTQFDLGADLVLQPSAMLRYVDNAPLSLDITSILRIGTRFGLGAAYRWDASYSGMLLFRPLDFLEIGYAYEAALNSEVRTISNGTHEVVMNLRL